jgi:hypothetical protein
MSNPAFKIIEKDFFITERFGKLRVSQHYPQTEFISVEENSEFQGIGAAGTYLFIHTVLVKILILTKGCRFYRQPLMRD